MLCSTLQPAAKTCRECNEVMAKYYCDKCKLWDNHPDKSIYHCDDCGICRQGKGLGEDYFHCKKCNICLSTTMKNHKCIERNLECDCPICGEYMFTSTSTVIFMVSKLLLITSLSLTPFCFSRAVIVYINIVMLPIFKHHINALHVLNR